MKLKRFLLIFALSFIFTGCLVDHETVKPEDEQPAICSGSALCRLQNPADTIDLSSSQKAEVISWFEIMNDSVIFALGRIHLDSLSADSVQFKLLSDLQVTIDSVVFNSKDTVGSDTVLDWRGSVASPYQGFVDLTFKNDEYESGFAVIDGKFLTLAPLGGSMMLVFYSPYTVWVGECSPAAKTAKLQLSCLP